MNISNRFRDENFRMMDSLFYLADQAGQAVMALYTHGDFYIEYFKRIRPEPKQENCRDHQDYEFLLEQWLNDCTVRSPHYTSFSDMVTGEIKRLKEKIA